LKDTIERRGAHGERGRFVMPETLMVEAIQPEAGAKRRDRRQFPVDHAGSLTVPYAGTTGYTERRMQA
jgi:hypothetical protein